MYKRQASSRPFGVNVPLAYRYAPQLMDVITEERVPAVFTSAGNPATWTARLRDAGCRVAHVVSSSKFALKSREAGVDAVVAEGFEAGGHNGREETTTMALVPQVRQAVDLPLRTTAEDLLHDAFLKIYGAFDRFTYRGTGSLRAWIERITVNVALEWIRSRSKLGSVTLDEGKAAAEVAELDVAEMARVPREVLMRFIGELPEGYRAVFNLYCIEEYSHRDIARMLGINEKSSSSQLFRARAMLARRIRAYLETH